jgi:putative membrane protein insertion efficiency factor
MIRANVMFAELVKAYILLLLRGYKALISPMLPNACRFVPTCSEYATEAIDRYGAFRGGLKAMGRLMRCNPFSASGYDPVILPEHPAGIPEVTQIWRSHACLCSPEFPASTDATPKPEIHTSRPDVWRC